ncbi:MAG: FAD-binding oxidoreductase [Gemmatimonadetes bacterium]|nr:FAD-binding oxidoreductase [Gemmatimonadota bacterium]
MVGAGCIGGWTTHHLQLMGAKVGVIDAYGLGNSRSTSGTSPAVFATSYGDRPQGEQWMLWAHEAIAKWNEWNEIFWKEMEPASSSRPATLITRARPGSRSSPRPANCG